MSYHLDCPKCFTRVRVTEEERKKRPLVCPHCGHEFFHEWSPPLETKQQTTSKNKQKKRNKFLDYLYFLGIGLGYYFINYFIFNILLAKKYSYFTIFGISILTFIGLILVVSLFETIKKYFWYIVFGILIFFISFFITEKLFEFANKASIVKFFEAHNYSHAKNDILYRSEGYSNLPNQPYYVKRHGIFSKRLIAELVGISFSQLKNDCALNNDEWKRMGKYYLKAYQIKERNPEYFKKVYNKLLKESYSIIQKRNDDPMQALCLLHTGWCMWESYLISTGDYSTARGYQGTTYKFTPRIWSNPLAFDTGQYCGATKNAVLLWISPEDYDIEIVR